MNVDFCFVTVWLSLSCRCTDAVGDLRVFSNSSRLHARRETKAVALCPRVCLHWHSEHACQVASDARAKLHNVMREINHIIIIIMSRAFICVRGWWRMLCLTQQVLTSLPIFGLPIASLPVLLSSPLQFCHIHSISQMKIRLEEKHFMSSSACWGVCGLCLNKQWNFPAFLFLLIYFCLCCFLSIAMHHLTLPKQVWAAAHQLKAIWSGAQLPGG